MRIGPVMKTAMSRAKREYKTDLREYLLRETNRGRTETSIANDFGVSRLTIRNWKKLLGLKKTLA